MINRRPGERGYTVQVNMPGRGIVGNEARTLEEVFNKAREYIPQDTPGIYLLPTEFLND